MSVADRKILVFGGTGPAGICLLRELAYRHYPAIVYARSPSKIPEDVASNGLLEIVSGEMGDQKTLSSAMGRASAVISLLGPRITDKIEEHSLFADIYTSSVFPLMREHGVRRILAMGTISIKQPGDKFNIMQCIMPLLMPLFANAAYQNTLNIARAFENHANGLDWTIFRLAQIPGDFDEASWKRDRQDGLVFTGWVGQIGWTSSLKRGALGKWLVNALEGGVDDWIGMMPSISKLAGT